jgi:carboxypeptidase family protein
VLVQTLASVDSGIGKLRWALMFCAIGLLCSCSGTANNPANVANNSTSQTQGSVPPSQKYSISGKISPPTGSSGWTVNLSGATSASTVAYSSGSYTFTGLANGTYAVTPSQQGYAFSPASQTVTINAANVTGVNFLAQTQSTQSGFSLSGTISPAPSGGSATVFLNGAVTATVMADSSGNFTFNGLPNGTYGVSPWHSGFKFAPITQAITINGASVSGINFAGAAGSTYFSTEPSHAAFLPRPDAYCTSAVTPNSWEPRPDNYPANSTVFDPSTFTWNPAESYWSLWLGKRNRITGNFSGTTTEIIQWAACKWGIDEDTIRADAVQESYWHQNTHGDVCSPDIAGEGSYGLNQTHNRDCTGAFVAGGFPDTTNSTDLAVDWFAARTRSCYDGDFYDGGSWLYLGQTVDQIAATNGWPYVFWACIGFNFSGNWSPGQQYQLQVQQILANRTWESPGF